MKTKTKKIMEFKFFKEHLYDQINSISIGISELTTYRPTVDILVSQVLPCSRDTTKNLEFYTHTKGKKYFRK